MCKEALIIKVFILTLLIVNLKNLNTGFKFKYDLLIIIHVNQFQLIYMKCTRDNWDDIAPICPGHTLQKYLVNIAPVLRMVLIFFFLFVN